MTTLDKRLHAYRDDLADDALKGKVSAERFVIPESYRVKTPFADVLRTPESKGSMDTQFIHGTNVKVFEMGEEWAWAQSESDHYVGYIKRTALSKNDLKTTHRIIAPRTFLYSKPDLKSPRLACLSMGSTIHVTEYEETRGTQYAMLHNGSFIIAHHIAPIEKLEKDYVTVAERLLHTPYLWGGTTGFGIDCSGLVQLSLSLAGHNSLRDTDMQEASLGETLEIKPEQLIRGDLVFWKGHVAIVSGQNEIIHANGHTMNVAIEPLDAAIERIAYLYEKPTRYKRIAPIG